MTISQTNLIYQFSNQNERLDWYVVNDGVMGGLSDGSISINESGHGTFAGKISLRNNGGFSSIRLKMDPVEVNHKKSIVLRIKGDGKSYQLRLKAKSSDYFNYCASFNTTEKWQNVSIPLDSFFPAWRGRKLDMGNFNSGHIHEIGILFGNKKEENFQLIIDSIALQ